MGGGWSWTGRCIKQDHIDPKVTVNMSRGITIADSQECASCSLSFPENNTSSAAGMSRDVNTIVLRPFVPFAATFNDQQFSFSELRLFHPAPMKIEGVQADAVLQCVGENLMIFIPLKRSASSSSSLSFLNTVAGQLDPSTSGGLGIVNSTTGAYEQPNLATGQAWSISNLVSGSDPYFTWVNSTLEQYVRADLACDRYLGWRSRAGAQVIYFQNPVGILAADIDKLVATVRPVLPTSIFTNVTNPLYSSGDAHCPPPLPKMKPQTFNMDVGGFGNVAAYFFSVLLVIFAVALVSFGVQTGMGREAAKDLSATMSSTANDFNSKPSGPPVDEKTIFEGLKTLADPKAALTSAANAKGADLLGNVAAVNAKGVGLLGNVAPPPVPPQLRRIGKGI